MTHAAVVQVELDPDSDAGHRQSIIQQFVAPAVEALPGFERAFWMNDGVGRGLCIALFDSAANAEAGLRTLTHDPGPPIVTAGVLTVEIETAAG
jgi:hypothetical protein